MVEDEQMQRPKHERYRWTLQGGLRLHMLRAGHLHILAIWRWDVEPSDHELDVFVEIVQSYEAAKFIATAPLLEFPTRGKVRKVKYVLFSFSQINVIEFEQTAAKQLALLDIAEEETAVPNNYQGEPL